MHVNFIFRHVVNLSSESQTHCDRLTHSYGNLAAILLSGHKNIGKCFAVCETRALEARFAIHFDNVCSHI
jgi:hypothetical protein